MKIIGYLALSGLMFYAPMNFLARWLLDWHGYKESKVNLRTLMVCYSVWYIPFAIMLIVAVVREEYVVTAMIFAGLWVYIANQIIVTQAGVINHEKRPPNSSGVEESSTKSSSG